MESQKKDIPESEITRYAAIRMREFYLLMEFLPEEIRHQFKERYWQILTSVLIHGKSMSQTGAEHGISGERARQIFSSAMNKLGRILNHSAQRFRMALDSIESLKEENHRLNYYLRINKINPDEIEREEIKAASHYVDAPIEDLNFNPRIYNCLKAMGVNTLREVCHLSRKQLMEQRNFGAVSLMRLENTLLEHDLYLEMDI